MISRRTFLALSSAGVATAFSPHTFAQTDDPTVYVDGMEAFEPLPEGFNNGLSVNPLSPDFGTKPPPRVYGAIASAILVGSPRSCRPIDVAQYFANLRNGVLPDSVYEKIKDIAGDARQPALSNKSFLKYFAYDWEQNKYFNPVVVGFFRGLNFNPYDGDITPWCATFVNWCISRSRARRNTEVVFEQNSLALGSGSPASGSFRCWGEDATQSPQEGDIVVWAKKGSLTKECHLSGQGHVAFLSKIITDKSGKKLYRVLGGNQGYQGAPQRTENGEIVQQKDIAQAVSLRTIGETFSDREFYKIRTKSFLR